MRDLVYLSYSGRDVSFRDELSDLLRRDVRLKEKIWDDTMIRAGADWQKVIEEHVSRARIIIMMISEHYLDRNCQAWKHEIPQALEAQAKGELTILWVPVGFVHAADSPVAHLMAAHSPEQPLNTLDTSARRRAYDQIKEIILSQLAIREPNGFNVFLSHNSRDKPTVRQLGNVLKERGLTVWLDEWELQPGRTWQDALEEIIATCQSAVVCVGANGIGPWEHPEMHALLRRFVEEKKRGTATPVIPVLLPGAPEHVRLPLFLEAFTWVDLRSGFNDAGLGRLQWGITGVKPAEAVGLSTHLQAPSWPATSSTTTSPTVATLIIRNVLPGMITKINQSLVKDLAKALRVSEECIILQEIGRGSLTVRLEFRGDAALARFMNGKADNNLELLEFFNKWKVEEVRLHSNSHAPFQPPPAERVPSAWDRLKAVLQQARAEPDKDGIRTIQELTKEARVPRGEAVAIFAQHSSILAMCRVEAGPAVRLRLPDPWEEIAFILSRARGKGFGYGYRSIARLKTLLGLSTEAEVDAILRQHSDQLERHPSQSEPKVRLVAGYRPTADTNVHEPLNPKGIASLDDEGNKSSPRTEVAPSSTLEPKVKRSRPRTPAQPIPLEEIRERVDIGIMTIRADEFDAILKRFSGRRPVTGGKRWYDFTEVATGAGEKLGIAIVRCPEQGGGVAQVVARDLIDDLNPSWLFLVGIGGGIPDNEYSLGDVVIANRLHDFSVSAALQDGESEYSVTGGSMHPDVQTMLAHMPAFENQLKGWNTKKSIKLSKPDVFIPKEVNATEFYGSDNWRRAVQRSLLANFPEGRRARNPKVRTAPVAFSNALIKSADVAAQWQQTARHTEAVEMELGGVYLAAQSAGHRNYRVLAIRGLSDIIGFKRSGNWTAYACNAAAAFAHALIVSGIIRKEPE